ncbi:MAG: hypothetical protein OXG70_03610 [Cyanobacteria bacterium MAG IRC1_bin_28]|nr:hypothetical protein [Cyanobacteria bacterium MAG IRC1_bin_28]
MDGWPDVSTQAAVFTSTKLPTLQRSPSTAPGRRWANGPTVLGERQSGLAHHGKRHIHIRLKLAVLCDQWS